MEAARKLPTLSDHIESTPDTCAGHPRVRGTRIKVSQIASEYDHMGMSPDEIVEAHPHITLADVHAALAYYYDNHEAIRLEWKEADALIESLKQKFPSRVAAKAARSR